MKYINHININSGAVGKSTKGDLDPNYLAAIREAAFDKIKAGETVTIIPSAGFTAHGVIEGKAALITVSDEGAPLVTIGICRHSRSSRTLWDSMIRSSTLSVAAGEAPPSAPWCAIRHNIDAIMPDWLDLFECCIAWAYMES
jgi:hypothetical protein